MIKFLKQKVGRNKMYCHIKDYEIRCTDTDFEDKIKLSSLLSLMEESACLSADELGFGYSALQPKKLGFILVNWYVELFSPIMLGDVVSVHTWPIRPKKMIVFRDFEFYVGNKKVGVATSRWCVVDLNSFSMVPSVAALPENTDYNENRSVDCADFRIGGVADNNVAYSKTVSYSDYDHYCHANNTKYGDYVMDAFSPDELKGKNLACVKITYIKQTIYGETLDFFKEKTDQGYLVEGRVGGEVHIRALLTFND